MIPPRIYPDKTCPVCGRTFNRNRYNGVLEDRVRYSKRVTCSQACGNTKQIVKRQTYHWRAKKHRKTNCEQCGSVDQLHVHHIDRDVTNNDPSNLATLCASCHLKLHWREDRIGGSTKRQSAATKLR